MANTVYSCCFTGHREAKLPWSSNDNDPRCLRLKRLIYDAVCAVYADGGRHFICGMANGCDLYFLEAALRLRSVHDDVTIEAAVPFRGQAEHWRYALRAQYEQLLRQCDVKTVLQEEYSRGCEIRRNEYMVRNARVLIAAYDGKSGGTQRTINFARKKGLQIMELPIEN